jgi:uncharacterized protein YlxW (UPF0749 family)
MEQSVGRKPTQIEKEAMQAICKLQDENRELRLEVKRLQKEVDVLERKSFDLYLDKELEIERLEARIDAYDKYIRGYLTLDQLEEALKKAMNPSPAPHSQTEGGRE